MLQYGGHHLALNITIVEVRGIITPTLTGAQPSRYTLQGKTIRPLGAESDKGLALLTSLDAAQRTKAILNYDVSDLVLGPGEDAKTILPEGLQASSMNAMQRAALLDLVKEWAGIVNDDAAAIRMKELAADLDETYFAWSGATTLPFTSIPSIAIRRTTMVAPDRRSSRERRYDDAHIPARLRRRRQDAMRTRLATIVLLCGAGLVGTVTPAFAHRVDEYLQAATISLSAERIAVRLRLTAGVAVASKIIAAIDTDGDIVLAVHATLPRDDPMRYLTFENHHQRSIAVYLVNTLVPADPAIHIAGQDRARDQSTYRLNFSIGAVAAGTDDESLALDDDLALATTYFWHGVHHILSGFDHLLFLAALVLGAGTLWELVKVVTAFTFAHSITLTLAALGWVHLPSSVVEPLIAASIVFVALQNVFWPEQSHGRSRLLVAFAFGLFHGLGFAGGLLEIMHQMPTPMILLAILGFSLGVEMGNQIVLLPLFGMLRLVRRLRANNSEWRGSAAMVSATFPRIGSAAVSIAGLYYLCVALVRP